MKKPALKLAAAWAATCIASSIKRQIVWIFQREFLVGFVAVIGLICNVLTIPIRFFWVMRWAYVEMRTARDDKNAWAHIKRFWRAGSI